jgi:VanZ family protein
MQSDMWITKKTSKLRIGFLIASILWLGIIFRFSSQPFQQQTIEPFLKHNVSKEKLSDALPEVKFQYNDSPLNSKKDPYHFIEFIFRKSAHITVYAVLAFLLAFGIRAMREHKLVKVYILLCLVALTACVDEWNQTRVQDRTGIIQDVGFDLTGGVLGLSAAALVQLSYRKFMKRKW